MSASLVGSEMCIRDRQPVCFMAACLLQGSVSASWHTVCFMAARLDCDEAVSYTHLTLPTICSV
eukprot:11911992-Alexandrium_andersonii.AAC.1